MLLFSLTNLHLWLKFQSLYFYWLFSLTALLSEIRNDGGDLHFYCHLKRTSIRGMRSIMGEFSKRKILTSISNNRFIIKEYPKENSNLNVVILFITNPKILYKFKNSGSFFFSSFLLNESRLENFETNITVVWFLRDYTASYLKRHSNCDFVCVTLVSDAFF